MNITCNIIRDLLPLYAENMLSEDSGLLVEEHIRTCEDCRQHLSELSGRTEVPADFETIPLKKIKSLMLRKKVQTVILSVILALFAFVLAAGNLTAPQYYPYANELVMLTEGENGVLFASFDEKASGYAVSSTLSDDKTGLVYHLVAWDSIWSRHIQKNSARSTVLNPGGEKVSAVYYYETDGSGEILLYGAQQNPSSVIIRQPKLALFAGAATVIALIGTALLLLFFKNKQAAPVISAVLLLPISYLLGHLIVKGLSFATFSATYDFYKILLASVPCYLLLFLFGCFLYKKRNGE